MAETFAEFVQRRKGEIQEQMKALRAELAQLAEAEKVLSMPLSEIKPRAPRVTMAGKPTLKEMAVAVLRKHRPDGADANTILALIKQDFDVDVPRSSMSPQLSRLGSEGVLDRSGLIWKLRDKPSAEREAQKDETPVGYQPTGASVVENPSGELDLD